MSNKAIGPKEEQLRAMREAKAEVLQAEQKRAKVSKPLSTSELRDKVAAIKPKARKAKKKPVKS
jgi:hypothetical protein